MIRPSMREPTSPAVSRLASFPDGAVARGLLFTAALASAWFSQRLAGESALLNRPVGALVAFAVALALVGAATRSSSRVVGTVTSLGWPQWERAALLGLFVAALLVRAWQAGEIPPALSGDEGGAGRAAVDIFEGRLNNPFVVSWYSFPSFYFFIPAVSIAALGASFEAIRLPSAIAGALTVVALYVLGRSMWDRRTGTIAALLIATMHTHIHFSRIGLNNIWDGLLVVLALAFFWRGWSTGRRNSFIAAGLTVGLSQYFYASGRLVPALLATWLVLALVTDRQALRARAGGLLSLLAVAVVVFLPLGIFFAHHPNEFAAPMNRVTILGTWLENEVQMTGEPAGKILLRAFALAASGFTVNPVRSWYLPGKPLLLPLAALLFYLGLLFAALRPRDPRPRLLIIWLFGVTCIGALTESPPAGQRYVVGLPAAALLAAWALSSLAAGADRRWPRARIATAAAVAAIVTTSVVMDLNFYFRQFVPSEAAVDPNTEVAGAIGLRLRNEPSGTRVFFFGPPRIAFASIPSLPFLAPQVVPTDIDRPLTGPPDWPHEGPRTVFVFLPERKAELRWVRTSYPEGRQEDAVGRNKNPLFTAWIVPASGTR